MIHPLVLIALQVHATSAVTLTLPLPVAAENEALVGEIENVRLQGLPVWVTVNVWPSMPIVPVRVAVVLLVCTEYVTVPLPVPFVAEVIVIQLAPLATFQAQLPGAVTAMLPPPPVHVMELVVGEIETLQVRPAWLTANVCPAMVMFPFRALAPVLGATV